MDWPGIELGAPVAGIKRKTSSASPGLFHIDEGGSRTLRNVLYYSLFVGLDEADFVAERIVVGTIPHVVGTIPHVRRMYLRN